MENRGVKRPRSNTPEKGVPKKKDKPAKSKKKKVKLNPKALRPSDDSNKEKESSMDVFATADGQYMLGLLSTFSKMETSRFEAFKRVAFPADAISKYVAHCLHERQQQQHAHNPNYPRVALATAGARGPDLEDLVVPGQAEEITTVVATLAKAYAQRLLAAAKAHAQTMASNPPKVNSNDTTTNTATTTAPVGESGNHIRPEHVLAAFYARKQQGQDPGFFLQPNEGITVPSTGKERTKRIAALATQEEFDRQIEEYHKEQNKEEDNSKATPMEGVKNESDSGDEEEIAVEKKA